MTTEQIKETEIISQDVVNQDLEVFAKEVPLAVAKDIAGLRAIFEEVGTRLSALIIIISAETFYLFFLLLVLRFFLLLLFLVNPLPYSFPFLSSFSSFPSSSSSF